jgi:hypothetical protein
MGLPSIMVKVFLQTALFGTYQLCHLRPVYNTFLYRMPVTRDGDRFLFTSDRWPPTTRHVRVSSFAASNPSLPTLRDSMHQ